MPWLPRSTSSSVPTVGSNSLEVVAVGVVKQAVRVVHGDGLEYNLPSRRESCGTGIKDIVDLDNSRARRAYNIDFPLVVEINIVRVEGIGNLLLHPAPCISEICTRRFV